MNPPRLIADADYDRRKFIGSSNVAAIMGLTPTINGQRYTALDAYLAKRAETLEEEPDNARNLFLKRRKRWEGPVFEHLREEFQAEIVSTNLRYIDGDVPFFASEIDFEWKVDAASAEALGLDPKFIGTIQNGEVKTVSPRAFSQKFGWGEPGTADIPVNYQAQVMFGLSILQREVSIVAALLGLDEMIFYVIRRDESDIAQLREACCKFWHENVLAGVPPEPQTILDLDKLYSRSTVGMVADGTSTVGANALRLRSIYGEIDAREMEAELLEFEIKQEMKTAEELVVDGRKLFTWKESNWSRLDQTGLKEKEKAIYKKFMLSGRHRVFTSLRSAPKT